jgi:hypothetical protein
MLRYLGCPAGMRTIQKGTKSPSREEGEASADGDNERRAYLRSGVVNGYDRRRQRRRTYRGRGTRGMNHGRWKRHSRWLRGKGEAKQRRAKPEARVGGCG